MERIFIVKNKKKKKMDHGIFRGELFMIWCHLIYIILYIILSPKNLRSFIHITVKRGFEFGKWKMVSILI